MGILGHLMAKKSCVPGIISWQNYGSEHEFSRPRTPNLASSRSLIVYCLFQVDKTVRYSVKVSYIEIYKEELQDLLDLETSSKDLHVREDDKGNTGTNKILP